MYEQVRNKRLTASNFGMIIKKRKQTPCHTMVKNLLYKAKFDTPATLFGKAKESIAIDRFMRETGIIVKPSGFYIYLNYGFLGASPDATY